MFAVGDLVVYGGEGVCRVESIGPSGLRYDGGDKTYYHLAPLYRSGTVMTPVDTAVMMRPIISRDRAMELIAALPQLLNGQDAMDRQRQKACIRQMELFFLFKLLQSRPDLFGRFCIQQGREDLVFRHPSAEHLCQFLFRHTAAQQGRHHPPVGRSIPLQPNPHAGAAEHLHPVGE